MSASSAHAQYCEKKYVQCYEHPKLPHQTTLSSLYKSVTRFTSVGVSHNLITLQNFELRVHDTSQWFVLNQGEDIPWPSQEMVLKVRGGQQVCRTFFGDP